MQKGSFYTIFTYQSHIDLLVSILILRPFTFTYIWITEETFPHKFHKEKQIKNKKKYVTRDSIHAKDPLL